MTDSTIQEKTKTRGARAVAAGLVLSIVAGGALVAGAVVLVGKHSAVIPYRGTLEQNGTSVDVPVRLSFRLYGSDVATTSVWGPEAHTVTPAKGLFSVLLGETSSLDAALAAGGDLYVGVEVQKLDGSGSPDGAPLPLLGRQLLGSVPFARRGAPGADFKVDGDLTVQGAVIPLGGIRTPVDITSLATYYHPTTNLPCAYLDGTAIMDATSLSSTEFGWSFGSSNILASRDQTGVTSQGLTDGIVFPGSVYGSGASQRSDNLAGWGNSTGCSSTNPNIVFTFNTPVQVTQVSVTGSFGDAGLSPPGQFNLLFADVAPSATDGSCSCTSTYSKTTSARTTFLRSGLGGYSVWRWQAPVTEAGKHRYWKVQLAHGAANDWLFLRQIRFFGYQ